jgi:hypothetical protein
VRERERNREVEERKGRRGKRGIERRGRDKA